MGTLSPPEVKRFQTQALPLIPVSTENIRSRVSVKPSSLYPLELWGNNMGLTVAGDHSKMKMHHGVTLIGTASYIHMIVALRCSSSCAACWKDNDSNGVDIKFWCTRGNCGTACPTGYSRIHCANKARCV